MCLSYSLLSSPSVSRCRLFGGAGGGSSRSLLVKVCSIRVVTVVTVSMKTFSCTWVIPVTDTASVTWKTNRCLESMSYKKLMCINKHVRCIHLTWLEQSSSFWTRLSQRWVSRSVSASILWAAAGLFNSTITSCPASDRALSALRFWAISSLRLCNESETKTAMLLSTCRFQLLFVKPTFTILKLSEHWLFKHIYKTMGE